MKKLKRLFSAGTVCVALVCFTSACNSPRGGVRTEGQVVDDRQLTRLVERRLANDPVYKYREIDVKTFAGVVQLSGFVDAEVQKSRAQLLAGEIPGVVDVENAVMVKPRTAQSERIRQELRDARNLPYPHPEETQRNAPERQESPAEND